MELFFKIRQCLHILLCTEVFFINSKLPDQISHYVEHFRFPFSQYSDSVYSFFPYSRIKQNPDKVWSRKPSYLRHFLMFSQRSNFQWTSWFISYTIFQSIPFFEIVGILFLEYIHIA